MRSGSQAGFTLAEVLVALLLLSVGLLGLEALSLGAIRSLGIAEQNSRAAVIASEYLEDAVQRIRRSDLPPSCTDQVLSSGARLTRIVEIGNDPTGLHQVTVTVVPRAGMLAPRPYTVRSHVFAPTTTGTSPSGTC